jgi:hypothetical protein
MIFVRVRKYNALQISNAHPCLPQTLAQSFVCFFSLGAGIDEREWVFMDQIAIDGTNVERRRDRDGNDAHHSISDCQIAVY